MLYGVGQGETEAAPPEQPRETCGSEYSVWPADIFKSKTLQGQIGCKICTDKALPRFAESSLDRK